MYLDKTVFYVMLFFPFVGTYTLSAAATEKVIKIWHHISDRIEDMQWHKYYYSQQPITTCVKLLLKMLLFDMKQAIFCKRTGVCVLWFVASAIVGYILSRLAFYISDITGFSEWLDSKFEQQPVN